MTSNCFMPGSVVLATARLALISIPIQRGRAARCRVPCWYCPSGALSFHLLHDKLRNYPAGLSSALHKSARMWLKPVKRAAGHRLHCFLCSGPGLGACGDRDPSQELQLSAVDVVTC